MMNKCEDCVYSKLIRTKHGFNYICKIGTEKEVRFCLTNNKKRFIKRGSKDANEG